MADTEPAPDANTTGKVPATPEGMMVAYGSLVIMALIPIYLGSFRSVESQKEQKENQVSDCPQTCDNNNSIMTLFCRKRLESDQKP